jgi:hypothetical protein
VEILILEFRHELAFPHGIALIDVGLQHNPVDLCAYSNGHLGAHEACTGSLVTYGYRGQPRNRNSWRKKNHYDESQNNSACS